MFKINMILYLYIATGLVAGEWQPQDYGQSQLRYSLPPPAPQFDQRLVLPTFVPEQPRRFPQARPCRRQNNGDIGAVLTDSGWVPLPFNKPSPSSPAHDQQSRNQPFEQLKPQSLTENRAPVIDDQKQDAKQTAKSKYPNKIVEYVEKSSLPKQVSQNLYTDDNENKVTISDQVINDNPIETARIGHVAAPHRVRSSYPDQTSLERVDTSHDISHECEDHVHPQPDFGYDNSKAQDAVKSAPREAQELAVKILPNCVQESRRALQHLEGDSKSSSSSSMSSSELDKIEAITSSKKVPIYDSKSDLIKSAQMPNKNIIKPYLQNPAKNAGKWQSDTRVSLLENGKVCYACSTYYDPSCWTTNATTTVKYCNKDDNACVSKMYKIEGKIILIRDCGHTCNDKDEYQVGQKMTSCSLCHADLCNGACALTGLSALLVTLIITLKFI